MKRLLIILLCCFTVIAISCENVQNSFDISNSESSLAVEDSSTSSSVLDSDSSNQSSVADSSSNENVEPPVDKPEEGYVDLNPNEHKYQSLKMQAPAKSEDIKQYQNYGVSQIDAYLTAICQDENIEYDTKFIKNELLTCKYAIISEQSIEEIDLIIADADNLLKKYILKDETLFALKQADKEFLGVDMYYYYGNYNGLYAYSYRCVSFTADGYDIEDYHFWEAFGPVMIWNGKEIFRIYDAYRKGLINYQILSEIYRLEYMRISTTNIEGEETKYDLFENKVAVDNLQTAKSENSPFYVKVGIPKTLSSLGSQNMVLGIVPVDYRKAFVNVKSIYFALRDNLGYYYLGEKYYVAVSEKEKSFFEATNMGVGVAHCDNNGNPTSLEFQNMVAKKLTFDIFNKGAKWLEFVIMVETNSGTQTYVTNKINCEFSYGLLNQAGQTYNQIDFFVK